MKNRTVEEIISELDTSLFHLKVGIVTLADRTRIPCIKLHREGHDPKLEAWMLFVRMDGIFDITPMLGVGDIAGILNSDGYRLIHRINDPDGVDGSDPGQIGKEALTVQSSVDPNATYFMFIYDAMSVLKLVQDWPGAAELMELITRLHQIVLDYPELSMERSVFSEI